MATKPRARMAQRDATLDDILKSGARYQQFAEEHPEEAPPPEPSGAMRRVLGDGGIALAKGVIGVPEAAVGLADLATGGGAGKFLENEGGAIGFRPKMAKQVLDGWKSPEQQAADKAVGEAQGFVDTTVAALKNPSVVLGSVAESAPMMLGGGVIARSLLRMAPAGMAAGAAAPVVAGAAGEGIVAAGSQAESIRQETPDGLLTGEQAGLAAASGLATGMLGYMGGKLAQRLGIADIDTLLAGKAGPAVTKGFTRRVLEGAVAEGLLEELPQSVQEQVAQNMALGKPLGEGVPQAAVLGALAGGLMGGGGNAISNGGQVRREKVDGTGAASRAINAGLENTAQQADAIEAAAVPPVVDPLAPAGAAPTEQVPVAMASDPGPAPVNPAVPPATPPEPRPITEGRKIELDGKQWIVTTRPQGGYSITSGSETRSVPAAAKTGKRIAELLAGGQVAPAVPAAPVPTAAPAPVSDSQAFADAEIPLPDEAAPPAPMDATLAAPIDANANQAATSPANDRPEPTDAQKKAGNYALGHHKLAGLDLSIENPAGSTRRGTDRDGKAWENQLQHHYGYIKGTIGNDKDHVDAFVKPGTPDEWGGTVFVVDQVHPDTGRFDEHKALVGFDSMEEAKEAYRSNYAKDWQGLKAISAMPAAEFKTWVKDGPKNKPLAPSSAPATPVAVVSPPVVAVTPPGAGVTPAAPATAAETIIEHVTGKGKTLRGVIRRMPEAEAKAMDPGTFKKNGGWFIRASRAGLSPERLEEIADTPLSTEGTNEAARPQAQAAGAEAPAGPPAAPAVVPGASGPGVEAAGLTPEAWWEKSLTPAGRHKAMLAAGMAKGDKPTYPDTIRWQYLPLTAQARLRELQAGGWDGDKVGEPGKAAPKRWEGLVVRPSPRDGEMFVSEPANDRDGGFQNLATFKVRSDGKAGKISQYHTSAETTGMVEKAVGRWNEQQAPAAAPEGAREKRARLIAEREAAPAPAPKPEKAEIRPYRRADGNIGYEAVPIIPPSPAPAAAAPAPAADPDAEKKAKALSDLNDALGDLAGIFGKDFKANMLPEQEQKLMPVLTRVMDAAFRAGYYSFKQAARFVLDTIRERISPEVADAISLDQLQGSYIAMAGKYKDQGATSKRDVVAIESLDELAPEPAPSPELPTPAAAPAQSPASQPPTATQGAQNEPDAAPALDQPSPPALAGVPAGPVQGADGERAAGDGAAPGGRIDGGGNGRADGAGRDGGGSLRAGEGTAPVPATGAGGGGAAGADRGVSGGTEPAADAAGVQRPVAPPEFARKDFRITDETRLGEGGSKAKYRQNVEAIRLINELERTGRPATVAEQNVLARYVGWGALSQAFDPDHKDWTKEYAELKDLLTADEWAAAFDSTQYAHYTSEQIVVDGIYAAVRRMGFTGGKTLEMGGGVGNFIGLMPEDLKTGTRFTLIERERISARIAKHLYPEQNVQLADATEFRGNDDYYDLAPGNPPFASTPLTDISGRKHLSGLSVHNYFFAKSVDMLRPGGILAQVVSNSFMDAGRDRARRYIGERTKLLGAIRLPNNAFAKNAGTEVTTDLIFLQKLPEAEWGTKAAREASASWADLVDIPDPAGGKPIPVNRYFAEHPEMMLGEMGRKGTMYRADMPALVARPGQDMAALLKEAVGRLPADVYVPPAVAGTSTMMANLRQRMADPGVEVGGFFERAGKLYQRGEDEAGEAMVEEITPATQWTEKTTLGDIRFDRIKQLAGMRVTLRALIAAEMEGGSRMQPGVLRTKLNEQYDAYVKDHGLINDKPTIQAFGDDPDFPLLASLENDFKPGMGAAAAKSNGIKPFKASAKKAPIFSRSVVAARRQVATATTPADALAVSMAERGRIDAAYMSQLLGKDAESILAELASGERPLLFKDPASNEYVLRDAYLSGNVRKKLDQAKAANMFGNARALEEVQPADVGVHEIHVRIGSPWVPTKVYEDFAKEIFGDGTQARIGYLPMTSGFMVTIRPGSEVAQTNTFGTNKMGGSEILEALLNNRTIKITYTGADKKTYTDKEGTEAANLKAGELRDKFQDWAFADPDRAEVLGRSYNDENNNYVTRQYDGNMMTFPGKVPDEIIKFRKHQRNAIARIVQDRTTLLDHVVGAGKTYTVIAGAMELKRTGLAKKSMITVPNHLVKQWAADFYRLYPGANILAATKKDFQGPNRRRFLARIATGDWDAVILAHSSFGFIAPAAEFEQEFNQRQVADIMATIQAVKNDGDEKDPKNKRRIKALAKMKEGLEQRIKSLRDRPMDSLLDFGQLGVDQLFVDEAHLFKNLMFSTKMQGVSGLGDGTGSQRAYDMYVKTQQVMEANGRGQGVVFATGTPISNSLAEMYHMQRYLMPTAMVEGGFQSFDAWANTYASVDQVWMQKISGDGFKVQNRMSTFVNTPELLKMFDQVSDTVTMDDIKKAYAEENDGAEFPLPKLKTGRRQPVSLGKSAGQDAYMLEIAKRAKALEVRRGPPKKGDDNHLTVMGDARKAAMDIRLVDPSITQREAGGRIDRASDEVVERYKKYDAQKGTQIVFSDLGTPLKHAKAELAEYAALKVRADRLEDEALVAAMQLGDKAAAAALEDAQDAADQIEAKGADWLDAAKAAERGFSVYDDFRAALIEKGIPAEEIAFIHDFNTDDQKAALFRKVNAGQIRVLMGSTPKLGAGTNVQDRLVALHHLDVPWKPSDVEQREGRIVRQGNLLATVPTELRPNPLYIDGFEVEILAYVTRDTLDMRMWQIQEAKLKMINQLRERKVGREVDNAFQDMEMSAGEMQAAATGNIDLLREIQLKNDVKLLEQKKRAFDAQRSDLASRRKAAQAQVDRLPKEIAALKPWAQAFEAYQQAMQEARPVDLTINGKRYTDRTAAQDVLRELTQAHEQRLEERRAIVKANNGAELTEADRAAHTATIAAQRALGTADGALEADRLAKLLDTIKPVPKMPKLAIEFNGETYGSTATVAEAFVEAAGDASRIDWQYSGKTITRRTNIPPAILPAVSKAMKTDTEQSVGSFGPYTVVVEGGTRKGGGRSLDVQVTLGGDTRSRDVSVQVAEGVDPGLAAAGYVESVAMGVASGASSRMEWAESDLKRAQKTLAELEATAAPEGAWPGEAELEKARAAHREVLKRLASGGTAPLMDDGNGGSTNIAQTGRMAANDTDVVFASLGFKQQTETPAFKRWFGDSKVVDAQDQPLVVYHGTPFNFTEFNTVSAGGLTRGAGGIPGAYFAKSSAGALPYARGGAVGSYYLSLRNPAPADLVAEIQYGSKAGKGGKTGAEARAELERMGYDGAEQDGHYIAFRPEQIKSATGNSGAFDPGNPSILADLSRVGDKIARQGYERADVKRMQAARRLQGILADKAAGKLTPEEFDAAVAALADQMADVSATKQANRLMAERQRGADMLRVKLINGRRTGDLDPEAAGLGLWLLDKNPSIASDLSVSILTPKDGSPAGDYNPVTRVIRLFKDAGNADTIAHEILHHTERMMPPELQAPIRAEHAKQVAAGLKAAQDQPQVLEALQQMLKAAAGSSEAYAQTVKNFKDGVLDYGQHYQLFNASEFWAVNGARILSGRYGAQGSWVAQARQWLADLVQYIRGALGLRSDAPVLRALANVTDPGNFGPERGGDFMSEDMLSQGDDVRQSIGDELQRGTEEQARAAGFTLKAYRGVSAASPFNDTGTTWLTTSREVAEAYAEEVMGYDDPAVLEVMVNPADMPRHDASRLTDEQREAMGADDFGNPQAVGIYDRSDDHPLGGSRRNVTVIHAPRAAVFVLDGGQTYASLGFKQAFSQAGASLRDVHLPANYRVGDFFNSDGRISWWHKTVGTMHNLAARSPLFKRTYDAVQNFINDVSFYATEAANEAPRILPKLDKWRDVFNSPLSPEQAKAIAAPIFEGTLTWARDISGKPVRVADLEAAAAQLDVHQKAQELLRRDMVDPRTLRMWQGLPMSQYESIIETKYAKEALKPGLVWRDSELKSMFGLTDGEDGTIGLYREARRAIDKSLNNLAIADMLRLGGDDVATMRPKALASGDPMKVAVMLRDRLYELAAEQPDRANVLNDTGNRMIDKADQVGDLKKRGYAPLSRFGQYTLDVVDDAGERVYFGLFESAAERAKMARQMRENFPGATIEVGTVSQEEYRLFAGVSPETLELFGEFLGLEADGDNAASKAFQTYIKLTKSTRSAMKRLIERKGIEGFSEDVGRVLAGFVYSNARQTAGNLHQGEITESVAAFPKGPGQLKDAAVQLMEYVKNPQEEAQAIRGMLFAQYLGGSVASALVNMTQPATVTLPYLSQFGGAVKAAKRVASAARLANKDSTGDAALDKALKIAEETGIVSPQEVHQLQAQAMGRATLRTGDGTKGGDLYAKGMNKLAILGFAWGKLFGMAEQVNRRITFIAAYRTAVDEGMRDPAKFAAQAVTETQFTYNKGNKPKWARGAVGSTLFTFKQYSISYLELMNRMWNAGDEGSPERAAGRKAVLLAMAVLFLAGGADGLPFMEDAEDVLDAFMQRLGYNFSSKQARHEFLADVLGDGGARFVANGLSGLPGAPLDVSGRMGMGNLIPGTGLLPKKADHTRDAVEVIGPMGDFAKRSFEAVGKLVDGEPVKALQTIAPTAARNAVKAVDMATTGMYRDERGRKVVDVDGYDAFIKALSFQPNDVARVQEATGMVQNMIAQNKLRESEIAEKWAIGIFEGDRDKQDEARAELARWNNSNHTAKIKIEMPQVLKRVRAMRQSKTERLEKTAPREIRAQVKAELSGQGQ